MWECGMSLMTSIISVRYEAAMDSRTCAIADKHAPNVVLAPEKWWKLSAVTDITCFRDRILSGLGRPRGR